MAQTLHHGEQLLLSGRSGQLGNETYNSGQDIS
jgi:hypothetical protein